MRKSIGIVLFLITFTACVKDKPQDVIQPQVQLTNAKKVYIVNEGNFGSPNASVSLYDPGNGAVIENFYQTQNPSSPTIGDVAQCLSFINDNFYLVVNHSGKIIVCDDQFKKTNQITGLSSPRYIQAVSNQKAYVSDFNGNAINIINLNTNTKTGTIPCPGWTEKMVLIYNKVFVCNIKRNYTYVINTINDLKTDSILVGPNAGSLIIDKYDKLWVLSGGDSSNSVLGKLVKIDPLTNQVETSFQFNSGDHPREFCINKTKDTLYFLNGGVFRMPIASSALPSNEFINRGTKNFYGLGINPNDHTIYAADALDYNSKANIYIYDASGVEKKHFNAGINANGFYFE
ncbi:MAG: DUF5074 domain-containing protein [Bacteroidia bacterium]